MISSRSVCGIDSAGSMGSADLETLDLHEDDWCKRTSQFLVFNFKLLNYLVVAGYYPEGGV